MKFEDSNKIFFTSDSHYFHSNILKYCNNIINDDSIVFHIGDFAFGRPDSSFEVLKQLKGIKFLIIGNHDKRTVLRKSYTKEKFEWIKDDFEFHFNDYCFYLSHRPNIENKQNIINLHGHVHKTYNILERKNSNILLDVGVDAWNFKPVSLSRVIEFIETFG